MPKKLTYEDVKKFVESREYKLLSETFSGSGDIIEVECKKGHSYPIKWSKFKSGSSCNYCSGHFLLYEDVKEYIESVGYSLLSTEYVNAHTKLIVKCVEGHEYPVTWNDFKNNKRCPKCKGRNTTYLEVLEKAKERKYVILTKEEDFIPHKRKKIQVICDKGHKTSPTLGSFMKGRKCQKCCPNRKLSHEEVVGEFAKFQYELLSDYKNSWTKMEVRCPNGHTYDVTWDNFKYGFRCPVCFQSKGEKRIFDFLSENNVVFQTQFKFNKCRNIKGDKKLRFDFYLPDYNLCIEYDGIQHFEPVDFFGGDEGLIKTKERDEVKNNYCKSNNINLLRIPYWDFDNIEKILNKELNI